MTVVPNYPAGSGALRVRTAARLALLACGVALALLTAGLILLLSSSDGPLPEGYLSRREQMISLVGLLGPPLLGGLIAARRPWNPYGWLWSAYALGWAVVGFNEAYVTYVSANGAGVLRWLTAVAWVGSFAFAPLLGLTALLLLLFPDGRLPSARWRWLAWAISVVGLVTAVAVALLPADEGSLLGNPFAMEGSIGSVAEAIANVGITVLFLGVLLAAASLLLRFRRAGGQQRQQLKWLAFGGAFLAAVIVLDLVSQEPPGIWDVLLETLSFGALYVGVGMAVLRHRLYDIDRLINRTLVYGVLTALLGLIYAGAVLVLGQLSGAVGAKTPSWAVAAATLAVAALFQPARRRIQAVVDRRFNRGKYNAVKTVEGFSARLRQEVDLDVLTAELLAVVDQTMQPSAASLWLRPSAQATSGAEGRRN
jgi:hypothetical protein